MYNRDLLIASLRALGLIIPALLLSPGIAGAQTTEATTRVIAGVVIDAGTQAPIAGATVSTTGARAIADASGRFVLRAPAGQVDLRVVAAGYFPLSTSVDVRTSDLINTELSLARVTAYETAIDVVGTSPCVAPATQAVQPLQVLRTPGALDNVYRTLQTLPGVSAAEEFGSRLAVRGGSPDQNLTMMDGVEVHDPYRLFGLTSAFNPETIQRFELATGGFSVKYGDRLSSLLIVENRDGTRGQGLTGSASLSITDANLVLEGGIPGTTSGSWIVTGRRTYYDLVAARVTDSQFPAFADLQAKGVWEPRAGQKLTLFGLRSRQEAAISIDEDTARGEFNDDTDNDLASLRFDAVLGSRGQSHTVAAYSDTRSTFGVDAAFEDEGQRSNAPGDDHFGVANVIFERALTVRDLSLRQELTWALSAHVIQAGAEAHQLSTALMFRVTGDRNPGAANGSSVQGGAGLPDLLVSSLDSTRGGLWLQDTWQAGTRGSLEAGLRLDHAGVTNDTFLSPRVSSSWLVGVGTRLRAGVGQYTQSPGYEKLAQGDYLLDLTNETARSLRSERSTQAAAGLERDLGRGVSLRAEGYYKYFTDLLLGRLEPESERLARVARYDFPASLASSVPTDPIITTVPTNDGRGRGYGFDVFVSRTPSPVNARLSGWASYTWGKANRDAYGARYAFQYDRRHALATVASYRFTPRWELATTARVASGFPRTAPIGVRVVGEDDAMDRDGDGITDEVLPKRDASGLLVYGVNLGPVANINQAKLPVFARMDLRATWRPRGPAGRWELYLEVINVLNRKNAGALSPRLEYDPASDHPRIIEERDQSVPRLPTVGVRFKF
jgi:TonB dependent receptor-like, beta-barrel/TonB-dependent Receptor Plug Domain/CarboxypepD_reg-like domain